MKGVEFSLVVQLVKNSPAVQETPSSIPGSGSFPGEGIPLCLRLPRFFFKKYFNLFYVFVCLGS